MENITPAACIPNCTEKRFRWVCPGRFVRRYRSARSMFTRNP